MYGQDPEEVYPDVAGWVGKILGELKPKLEGGSLVMATIDPGDDHISVRVPEVVIVERVPGEEDHIIFRANAWPIPHAYRQQIGDLKSYPELEGLVAKHSPYEGIEKIHP